MREQEILKADVKICDIHAERIQQALRYLKPLLPIQPSALKVWLGRI